MSKSSSKKDENVSALGSSLIMPGDGNFQPPSELKPINGVAIFLKEVEAVRDSIESLDVFHNQVLVAKYVSATIGTSGRLVAANQSKKEDLWQGKVGLVIKVGPGAFVDDVVNKFHGMTVKPGDWVMYRNTDGWDFDVTPRGSSHKVPCKFLEDAEIKGRVPRPDILW